MKKNLSVILTLSFIFCSVNFSLAEQKLSPPTGFKIETNANTSRIEQVSPKKFAKARLIAEAKKLEVDLLECLQRSPGAEKKISGEYFVKLGGPLATWELMLSTADTTLLIIERTVDTKTGEDLTALLVDDNLDGIIDAKIKYCNFDIVNNAIDQDNDTIALKAILNKFLNSTACSK